MFVKEALNFAFIPNKAHLINNGNANTFLVLCVSLGTYSMYRMSNLRISKLLVLRPIVRLLCDGIYYNRYSNGLWN